MCQIMDTVILYHEHLRYNGHLLLCGALYLVIGVQLGEFKVSEISENFSDSSQFLTKEIDLEVN